MRRYSCDQHKHNAGKPLLILRDDFLYRVNDMLNYRLSAERLHRGANVTSVQDVTHRSAVAQSPTLQAPSLLFENLDTNGVLHGRVVP